MSKPDDGFSFEANFIHRQLTAVEFVAALIAAVTAFIDAVITDIEGSKDDDALTIDGFFDLTRDLKQAI